MRDENCEKCIQIVGGACPEHDGIISPFKFGKEEAKKALPVEMMEKIKKIVEEHRFKDFLIMVHDKNDFTEQCTWIGCSSLLSDCLIKNLEHMTEDLSEELERSKNKDHG